MQFFLYNICGLLRIGIITTLKIVNKFTTVWAYQLT